MDQRAKGLETEFGVRVYLRAEPRNGTNASIHLLEWPTEPEWLRNGGLRYLDQGIPEVATAECFSPLDLVAHDKAGEREMEALALAGENQLLRAGIEATAYVYKNNRDAMGNSRGCHENYQVERQLFERVLDSSDATGLLATFLATRPLIAGAGYVQPYGDGYVFGISQRAAHMTHPLGATLAGGRGLITNRREAHADERRFGRLHLIAGDSNMSETTTLLKLVATELVIGMLEEGSGPFRVTAGEPVAAMRLVDRDLTFGKPIQLFGGGTMTAVDIQQAFLDEAREFAARTGRDRDPVVAQILELWGYVLEALRQNRLDLLRRDIDWAAKLHVVGQAEHRHQAEHDQPLPFSRAARIDLAYHDVNRRRGLYHRMAGKGLMTRVLTDEGIEHAVAHPPEGRATLRTRFAPYDGRGAEVSWDSVHVLPQRWWRGTTVRMGDPAASSVRGAAPALVALRAGALLRRG